MNDIHPSLIIIAAAIFGAIFGALISISIRLKEIAEAITLLHN